MASPRHSADELSQRRDMILAHNVKALREALGWSREELAARSGVSNIKMIEYGRRHPRPEQQKKIASTLGVPVWRLHVDKTGRPVPKELQQLMETPLKRKPNDEEYNYLLALPSLLGRKLTYEAYLKAFEMLQLTEPDEELEHPPEDDDSSPGD